MSDFLEQVRKIRGSTGLTLKASPLISDAFKPYAYQVPMVVNMLFSKCMVNGDDTGLGKTIEAACYYALRRTQDPALNCLIVSPKNALFQWRDEFQMVCPSIPVTVIRSERPTGGRWKRDPEYRAYQYQHFRSGVMICNYQQLFKEWQEITKVLGKFVVIYDEATKFKGLKTQLHKVIKQVSAVSVACHALTATVIKGHLYEAYGICDGMNIAPWGSKFRFDSLFPIWKKQRIRVHGRSMYVNVVDGWRNLDQFRREFEPHYWSRMVEDVAKELPEVITKNLMLEMPEKNREKYKEAENGLFQLPDGSIKEAKVLASMMYCQFVSNSPLEMGFTDYVDSKVEALQELLDNELEDEKVMIYSRYKRMVDYLEGYFASRSVSTLKVTGDVSDEDRYAAKNRFRDDPSVKIFLLNNAGSEAMNLQVTRSVICVDLPWSFGDYKQLIGRARRQGGKQVNILVFHLMHRDTVDGDVYEVLEAERKLVEGATGKVNEIFVPSEGDFAGRVYQRMLLRRGRMEHGSEHTG